MSLLRRLNIGMRAIPLVFGLLLAGCIPSLHPLFSSETLVSVEGIEGNWRANQGEELAFSPTATAGLYRAIFVDQNGAAFVFDVGATQIGSNTYLDFVPATTGFMTSEFFDLHISKWHSFAKLSQQDGSLRLSFGDAVWLRQFLNENPTATAFIEDDRVRLTGSTDELRAFVETHDAVLFDTEMVLVPAN
ncbi:MAG: hypothetical protein ACJASV_000558 [Pseudorhodobacter sp.]|jgi:hypothetical protein